MKDVALACIIAALAIVAFSGPVSRFMRGFDPEYQDLRQTRQEYEGYRQGVLDANQ